MELGTFIKNERGSIVFPVERQPLRSDDKGWSRCFLEYFNILTDGIYVLNDSQIYKNTATMFLRESIKHGVLHINKRYCT